MCVVSKAQLQLTHNYSQLTHKENIKGTLQVKSIKLSD